MESTLAYVYYSLGDVLTWGKWGIGAILGYALCIEVAYYTLAHLLALFQSLCPGPGLARRMAYMQKLREAPPRVSVIVPGYNENAALPACIDSLLAQNYPALEIIVVDDGSTDATPRLCAYLARQGKMIYLRNHLRGGKSSALNLGLSKASGEFIITVDADTILRPDAIVQILAGFAAPKVGAVSGNLRVKNAEANLLTRLQSIHYILAIGIGRRWSAWANTLLVVSGAFGAFRRRVIEQVGGWDIGPGEDADITLKVRRAGYRIEFCPAAMGYTSAPESWGGYIRQQRRWGRCLVRARLRKHSWAFNPFQAEFDLWAWLGTLDIFVFQVFLSYNFLIYLAWLAIFCRPLMLPALGLTYLFYLVYNGLKFLSACLISEHKAEDIRLMGYIPLYVLFIGYFLRFIRLWAYTEEFFWRISYRDPHVPRKVQDVAPQW